MVNTRGGSKVSRSKAGVVVWWLVRAMAAAVLGVATTLAVAYGVAVTDSTLDFGGYGDGDLYMMRETNRWWDAVTVISGDESNLEAVARVRGVKSWDDDSIAEVVRAGNAGGLWPRQVIMVGWPARCLWGAKGGIDGENVEALTEAPEWVTNRRYVHYPLPTAVWWPGMVANVGLFGGAWLALLAGLRAVRGIRAWRWGQKGLCVGCGYDARGAASGVCPECGMAIKTGLAVADGGAIIRPGS